MHRILSSDRQRCQHLTRRDLLQAGGSALLGLGLGDLATQDAVAALGKGRQFGKAKNVILLYLYGAMSQIDTLDPKPDGPAEIRGPFQSIATALPGVRLSEHLPGIAQRLDRMTVVRSMNHPVPIHNVANAVTGIARTDVSMELNAHDPRHWPFFGSVLQYLDDEEATRRGQRQPALIPPNVILPWRQSAHAPENRAGMYGGFLGARYDPAVIEFPDKGIIGTKTLVEKNPYGGIDRDSKFRFPSTTLPAGVTLDRFNQRRNLLSRLADAQHGLANGSPSMGDADSFQKMALTLCDSTHIPAALDLDREPAQLRERYGYHLFGQSALMARRLIESGARVATVFWDEFVQNNSGWDTHNNQTRRLRDVLCPGLDQTVSALLDDLGDRGMLDETLVLVLTEHGRTPKAEGGDGRNHWSSVYSIAMAGAGVARGNVVGASDSQGGIVKDRPVGPNDILHTIYHLLGVDADRTIPGIQNRPTPLVDGGRVVREILA
ncbi:MAG: hypothetical protein ACI9HK_000546 [Pirellulaceae bacterium]|jgi:hypothetical protein